MTGTSKLIAQEATSLWLNLSLVYGHTSSFQPRIVSLFLSDKVLRSEMHAYLASMLQAHKCEKLIVGGVEDHTHSLFALPRTHAIASIVKEVKRTSSSWIQGVSSRQSKFHWQGGYAAFSVSQSNLADVIRYIENQEEHHKQVSFQDEYRSFLKTYSVEFDERYVWD